jgi:hypothetical protein
LIEDYARRGAGIALERYKPGKFRTQRLVEVGAKMADTMIDAICNSVKELAGKVRLNPTLSCIWSTGRDELVLLTPNELDFRGDSFIQEILDSTRLREWSEDVLDNQLVELCPPGTHRILNDQRTCIPGKRILIAELGHEEDKFATHVPYLDGIDAKWNYEQIGHNVKIDRDQPFLFRLRNKAERGIDMGY